MKRAYVLFLLAVVVSWLLPGCFPAGDAGMPIPHVLVPSKVEATRLVVVLPGRGDDLAAMQRTGMAEAIQAAWPDADVILTGLSYNYYMQGRAPQRLHAEVITPARQHGYRQVWLVGASMGGMGTLMYDQAYPGEMDGLILLAPYLGEDSLLREIGESGGIARWQPGPVPERVDSGNFQRELWRHLQGWSGDPTKASGVWLAYGDRDRLRKAMPLLEPLLPPAQINILSGGHDWKVWSNATRQALSAASAGDMQTEPQVSP